MYCCSLLQNIILGQLFGTCTNYIFTTYTGTQKSQFLSQQDKDWFKIENVRPTFFICVVEASSFLLSFFLCRRAEREGLPLASNHTFYCPYRRLAHV